LKIQARGNGLRIALSRTNLTYLLEQLGVEGSARTLNQRGGVDAAFDFYDVVAEEDAAHYGPHTPLAKGGSA
jgi:hypothetical protein